MAGVPFLPEFTIFGYTVRPIVADVNIGVLYVVGVMAVGMYAPLLGGMASHNKWSILGAARTVIQMLSFEVVTGLSLIAPLMIVGSLSLIDINNYQGENGYWLAVAQPVAFVLYLISGYAETNRTPFDLLEHEAEIVTGYATEYSGMRWGLFAIGEYANMFTVAFVVYSFVVHRLLLVDYVWLKQMVKESTHVMQKPKMVWLLRLLTKR
jgi:NADH-quinone oxidoreductase subunit H